MGAWGAGSFDNDDAADWVADFCDDPNEGALSNALSTVADLDAAEYLEAPDCSVALAAAEVVAALRGAPNSDMPDDVGACVAKLKVEDDAGLASLALRAVERIKTNSELKELWDESEDPGEWDAAVGDLEARLRR